MKILWFQLPGFHQPVTAAKWFVTPLSRWNHHGLSPRGKTDLPMVHSIADWYWHVQNAWDSNIISLILKPPSDEGAIGKNAIISFGPETCASASLRGWHAEVTPQRSHPSNYFKSPFPVSYQKWRQKPTLNLSISWLWVDFFVGKLLQFADPVLS